MKSCSNSLKHRLYPLQRLERSFSAHNLLEAVQQYGLNIEHVTWPKLVYWANWSVYAFVGLNAKRRRTKKRRSLNISAVWQAPAADLLTTSQYTGTLMHTRVTAPRSETLLSCLLSRRLQGWTVSSALILAALKHYYLIKPQIILNIYKKLALCPLLIFSYWEKSLIPFQNSGRFKLFKQPNVFNF